MAKEKRVQGVIVPRNDIASNWAKAVNFIPKKSELVVFNADTTTYSGSGTAQNTSFTYESSDKVRFKFGDGVTNVNLLPFVTTGVYDSGGKGEDVEATPISLKVTTAESIQDQQEFSISYKDFTRLSVYQDGVMLTRDVHYTQIDGGIRLSEAVDEGFLFTFVELEIQTTPLQFITTREVIATDGQTELSYSAQDTNLVLVFQMGSLLTINDEYTIDSEKITLSSAAYKDQKFTIVELSGNAVGATPNPRPDWAQTDETKADYIKNKPDISGEINSKVAELVDSAPETLNTLNELAEALGDDPNFATTIATQLSNKVEKVEGKDLSTNDFTDAYKDKLDNIEDNIVTSQVQIITWEADD